MTCACTKEKTIKLINGNMVCSYCPSWLIETEARELMNMTLAQRQLALARREKVRGSVEDLKEAMRNIFNQRKAEK